MTAKRKGRHSEFVERKVSFITKEELEGVVYTQSNKSLLSRRSANRVNCIHLNKQRASHRYLSGG